MTDLTKNFEQLGINDLVEACKLQEIKVTGKVTRDKLLKKLQPEK